MKSTTLTRKELYDLVWSKPLTHIAKEFGLSDNGVRKVCKKHNIPLPKAGHWSKLKHGKKVEIKILNNPSENPEIPFSSNINESSQPHTLTDLARAKKEVLKLKEEYLTVPQRLSKPVPLVTATKRYFENEKIRKKRGDWRSNHNEKVLDINVSEHLLPRALRIMDTFIKLLQKRNISISVDIHTKITVNGETYGIRLKEKNKRTKKEKVDFWDRYEYKPSGELSFKIDSTYPLKEWADSKNKKVEDKLADILAWIEVRAEKDKKQRIEREIEHKKWEEEEKKRKIFQKEKDEELFKFLKLFESATRWHKSQYIRNYIKEYEQFALKNDLLDNEKISYIEWAKEKADWYDPFIEKEVALLEDIDRDTLKQKPKTYW